MFHSYKNENNPEFPKLEEICSQKSRNDLEIAVLVVKYLSFFSAFFFFLNSLKVQRIDNALMWIIVAAASFLLTKKDHSCTAWWKKKKSTQTFGQNLKWIQTKLRHNFFFWFGLQYDLTSRKHYCFRCSIMDQKQAEIWQAIPSGETEESAIETLILMLCKSRYLPTHRGCS